MEFRLKPKVVEAMQWLPNDFEQASKVAKWLEKGNADFEVCPSDSLYIETREGELCAAPNDWIIRDAFGFYPRSPEAFEAMCERVKKPGKKRPDLSNIVQPDNYEEG